MGVAAKYVFAIVVLLFCFTAGFGLTCYDCTSVYGRRDDCNIGRGMPSAICDAVLLWGEIEAASALLKTTYSVRLWMPDLLETTEMGNVACIKMVYKNSSGEDQIGRSCTFKMFDGVDGCGVAEKIVSNLRVRHDTREDYYEVANLTGEMAKMYPKPAHCRVCHTDLCNSTIGLTPAFLIYPPLYLLVLIKCKLFFQ